MKKILVPCDFSKTSEQAFRFACEIASLSKGEVFLLNIIELPAVYGSMVVPVQAYEDTFLKELKAKANSRFEKMKDTWGANLKVHFAMETGSVLSSINDFAGRKKIDLIVMGTHGSSGFEEYAIGSNAEKVVRSSKVPVIAVKKASTVSSIKNVVFPTNFKLQNTKLLEALKMLQEFFKAELHILFVNTPGNFNRDIFVEKRLREFAKQNQLKNYSINIYNDIDEESGIIDFSARFKNKIIAMPTHGRRGLSHLLTGSIAEDVVNHIDCPVWTFVES